MGGEGQGMYLLDAEGSPEEPETETQVTPGWLCGSGALGDPNRRTMSAGRIQPGMAEQTMQPPQRHPRECHSHGCRDHGQAS